MKKALPLIIIAALVAAAFYFLRRGGGSLDLSPGQAAALAPAETLVFVEVPDVARTMERWTKTSLYAISQEPEWKEFTKKLDDFWTSNDSAKEVLGVIAEIERADPSGMFFALTAFDGPMPKFVGGFPYRGKKADVKLVVDKLRDQILKAWPAAKSTLSQYEGTDIETLSDTNFTAALAYRENWFFYGSDVKLVQEVLHRHAAGSNAPPGLAGDTLFAQTVKQGNVEPDLTVYVSLKAVYAAIAKNTGAAGARGMATAWGLLMGAGPATMKDPTETESMLFTMKLDGPLMRDRIYYRQGKPPQFTGMKHGPMAFTSKASYAYAALDVPWMFGMAREMMNQVGATAGGPKPEEEANKELGKKGLTFADIGTTFGPEVAVMSDWEENSALPTLFAAAEVRDEKKARLFAELMAEEMKGGSDDLIKKEEDATTLWTLKGSLPVIQPTYGVNAKHLVFGLTPGTVSAALKQLKSGGPGMAAAPSWQGAMKTVIAPGGMTAFVDMKPLFERLYQYLKPQIAYALLDIPEGEKYFDASKFPKAETFSRHLQPFVMSYGAAENGTLVEATGSVSMIGAQVVVVGGALFSFRAMSAPPAGSAKFSRTDSDIQTTITQIQLYEVTNGALPSTEQGLKALVEKPAGEPQPKKWGKLLDTVPLDFWGTPYQYRNPGKRAMPYEVFSNGPDKLPDTADDIGNW